MKLMKRLGLLAILLTFGLAPASALAGSGKHHADFEVTTASEEAKKLFKKGRKALDRGYFLKANALFRKAVAADPEFAYAWLNIANSANTGAEFNANVKKAVEFADGTSEGEQLLIAFNATFLDNNAEERLKIGEKLTKKFPNNARAWVTRAGGYTSLNRHDEARKTLARAAELAPEWMAPQSNLGFSYMFNEPKDFGKSAKYFEKAIELDPENGQAWVNLGDAHRAQKNLERARADYTKAVTLEDGNSLAFIKRGHVNSFLGNFDEARTDYQRSIDAAQRQARANFANYKAFTHVHAGNSGAAIAELKGILKTVDDSEMAKEQAVGNKIFTLTNIATIALHEGDFEAAEWAIKKRAKLQRATVEGSGDDARIRAQEANIAYFEGQLAARRGDFETAMAKAKRNAELVDPDPNPRKLEPYHDLMGLIALRQGEFAKAVKHYEQANPGFMYSRYHLALALEGAGEAERAQALFREVGEWNFNSVGFALVRREALSRAGEV